jgi:hypothetical protein
MSAGAVQQTAPAPLFSPIKKKKSKKKKKGNKKIQRKH